MALYSEDLLEEIRLANDIVDVAGSYVQLKKSGKDYMGLCPFHREKTPSFSVVPSKQIFYCFGCNKGGNVFKFIELIENLDYRESIEFLADRAKILLPAAGDEAADREKIKLKNEIMGANLEAARFFYMSFFEPESIRAREYLMNRGISDSTLKKFGIGYCPEGGNRLYSYLKKEGFSDPVIKASGLCYPVKDGRYVDRFKGRIIFPIIDLKGKVVAFGGRIIQKGAVPKYVNSPESPAYHKGKLLFAMNFAKNSGRRDMIIVEGYMDAIALHQSGITNSAASLGTSLTELQARLLRKYAEEVVLSYDSDAAGQAAAIRGMDILDRVGCNVKILDIKGGKDPDEYIRSKGADGAAGFLKLVENALPLVEYKIDLLKKASDMSSTEGRIDFLTKMAKVLSEIDNDVKREMYINKLSDEYGITAESMTNEIRRQAAAANRKNSYRMTGRSPAAFSPIRSEKADASTGKLSREADKVRKTRTEKLEKLEMTLIALICTENSLYGEYKDIFSGNKVFSGTNRQAAEYISARIEKGNDVEAAEITDFYQEDKAGEFARIILNECNCDDFRKAVADVAGKIGEVRLDDRKEEIISLLEDMKDKQDHEKENELRRELMSIMSEKRDVQSKITNNRRKGERI